MNRAARDEAGATLIELVVAAGVVAIAAATFGGLFLAGPSAAVAAAATGIGTAFDEGRQKRKADQYVDDDSCTQ